jgi:hypothetical protein
MAKKPTKSEKEFRVNQVVRLLINCASRSSIVQYSANEWGVSARTADKYIAEARLVLREDANIERHDYLASRLQTLDSIVQKSVKAGQFNNAIGALKLQSELLGLNKH